MKEKELITLGECLKSKRVFRGFTQSVLASHAGVDRNYIGMVERGERNPSYLSLLKIARGLNMSVHELLTP